MVGVDAHIDPQAVKCLLLVPKGRWREAPEGIRTGSNHRLTTPQSRFASQLPFTGEPLVRRPYSTPRA